MHNATGFRRQTQKGNHDHRMLSRPIRSLFNETLVRMVLDVRSHSLPSKASYRRSKMFKPPVSQTTRPPSAICASLLRSATQPKTFELDFVRLRKWHRLSSSPNGRRLILLAALVFLRQTMRHISCHQHTEMHNNNNNNAQEKG